VRLLAEVALVVIAAIGVAVCVALLPRGSSTQRRRGRVAKRLRPEQLVNVERLVITAEANALQTHAYLRPALAEIASWRLAAHGYALESMPEERGRRLLGELLWEIVRPRRPFPEDRHAPGVSAEKLGEMLDVLEGL
jgi:hypothetical protein